MLKWDELDTEEKRKAWMDTVKHIDRVGEVIDEFSKALTIRKVYHDDSKLNDPELSMFAEWGPKLSEMEYGSDEYKAGLASMGPALDHHYKNNRHHPEYFPNGITDMSLIDIIEMMADWKAAGERVKGGSMDKSLKHNIKRFKIPRGLALVMVNTAVDLGWIEKR